MFSSSRRHDIRRIDPIAKREHTVQIHGWRRPSPPNAAFATGKSNIGQAPSRASPCHRWDRTTMVSRPSLSTCYYSWHHDNHARNKRYGPAGTANGYGQRHPHQLPEPRRVLPPGPSFVLRTSLFQLTLEPPSWPLLGQLASLKLPAWANENNFHTQSLEAGCRLQFWGDFSFFCWEAISPRKPSHQQVFDIVFGTGRGIDRSSRQLPFFR